MKQFGGIDKKRRITFVLALVCMLALLLAACGGDGKVTAEKAERIVLDELGMSAGQANPHVHVGEHEGKPCYSVYVTVDGVTWEYLVDGATGEILESRKSSHSH